MLKIVDRINIVGAMATRSHIGVFDRGKCDNHNPPENVPHS